MGGHIAVVWHVLQYINLWFIDYFFLVSWVTCFAICLPKFYFFSDQSGDLFCNMSNHVFFFCFFLISWVTCFAICQTMFFFPGQLGDLFCNMSTYVYLYFFLVSWVTCFAIYRTMFYLFIFLFLSGHLGDLLCNMSTHVLFINLFFFLVSWVTCSAICWHMFYLFIYLFLYDQLGNLFRICRPIFFSGQLDDLFCNISTHVLFIYLFIFVWSVHDCFAICQPVFYLFIYFVLVS